MFNYRLPGWKSGKGNSAWDRMTAPNNRHQLSLDQMGRYLTQYMAASYLDMFYRRMISLCAPWLCCHRAWNYSKRNADRHATMKMGCIWPVELIDGSAKHEMARATSCNPPSPSHGYLWHKDPACESRRWLGGDSGGRKRSRWREWLCLDSLWKERKDGQRRDVIITGRRPSQTRMPFPKTQCNLSKQSTMQKQACQG